MSSHTETNRSFYDRISSTYDFIADAGEHRAREAGEDALQVQAGERVLEVGFGTGNSLVKFAQQVGLQGRVDGIDISPGMISVAQRKLEENKVEQQTVLLEGDARKLPYDDKQFDAAFLSFTLELFPEEDIPAVLDELRRVLKKEGRLAVVSMATVRDGDKESLLERTYLWMHRHFPHIVDCRPIDVEDLLEGAGFEIVGVQDMEIWTMPVRIVTATPLHL